MDIRGGERTSTYDMMAFGVQRRQLRIDIPGLHGIDSYRKWLWGHLNTRRSCSGVAANLWMRSIVSSIRSGGTLYVALARTARIHAGMSAGTRSPQLRASTSKPSNVENWPSLNPRYRREMGMASIPAHAASTRRWAVRWAGRRCAGGRTSDRGPMTAMHGSWYQRWHCVQKCTMCRSKSTKPSYRQRLFAP